MIQTTSLLPPPNGPMANPLLFGVAAGLAALFPLAQTEARDGNACARGRDADTDGARKAASPREA